MKKALKIIGITLLVILLILLIAPFLFKGSIEDYLKKEINNNLNAKVTWEQLDLSLLRSFPDASVGLEGVLVENNAPFEGDTLFYAKNFTLDMGLLQLFKNEGYALDAVSLTDAAIHLKTNINGNSNWDITKEDANSEPTSTAGETPNTGFQLTLKQYEINNSTISFVDEQGKIAFYLKDFNHRGDGDFTQTIFNLNTHTDAFVSFEYEGVNYLQSNFVQLDAVVAMDLEKMKFTFLDNEAIVNQLALKFNGYYQLNEKDAEMDIQFSTPTSDFKNFLALIPETYTASIEGVETTGNFDIDGRVYGNLDETYIPKLDIKINSSQASFKYPDLPKKVEDIFMDIHVVNTTGLVEDTQVNISDVRFKIDEDQFSGKMNLSRLTTNMLIDLDAKGKLNLGKISQVYPMKTKLDLNGILLADINAKFDMEALEKERYQDVQTTGNLQLQNFHYQDEELPNAYDISEAQVAFSTNNIRLEKLNLKTGTTDISAKGKLDNLMGFMFSKQALKGRFTATSQNFALTDFMSKTDSNTVVAGTDQTKETKETTEKVTEEAIKIPAFLDIVLDFTADKVRYDQMQLTNATGSMIIVDERASLQDVSADLFGGIITMNGGVSTKADKPVFDIKMGLSEIDIVQIVQNMELARALAPIANALVGKVSTNFDLAGNLTSDFSPIFASLVGGALAQINQATVNPQQTPLLNQLNQNLELIDFSKMNLKGLTTQVSFKDGNINVNPFDLEIEGVKVNVNGSHNFDSLMDYTLDFQIPAKKLGSSVSSQLAKLAGEDVNQMTVNLPVNIGGTFTNPQLQMNMQNAVQQLTNQIIEKQKQKLKDDAKEQIGDKIQDLLGGNSTNDTKTDSTSTEKPKVEEQVKDILGGFLGKKKKE